MTAKANKNEAEELLGNLDVDQVKAEAALKTASKVARKKTVETAKKTGKTAGGVMEEKSGKTTGKTAGDATILKATTVAKKINGTVGGKRRKAIDERPDEATGKRPNKAIGERLDEAADKRVCKAAAKRPSKATKLLKDAILKAAKQAGNQLGEEGLVSYLEAQALKNASSFLTLLGKVLPLQLSGENGGAIKTVTKIELVAMKDPHEAKARAKDK